MDNKEIIVLLEGLSNVFKVQYMRPLWKKYNLNDTVDAASLFLEGYAFERQGRSPAFSPAAVASISNCRKAHISEDFPLAAWEHFCGLLNNQGLNPKLNPLFHHNNSCNCIWCILKLENMILSSKNALQSGQTKEAWKKLVRIRGIGPKIASLFLRDVAIIYEDELLPAKDDDRWLLQPIDIWVRRIVMHLDKSINNKSRYEEIAKWIVKESENPEYCNQGMWYFGAKIAQTEFKLDNCLIDPQNTINKHIIELHKKAQSILEMEHI
jgi:hypothetical protein